MPDIRIYTGRGCGWAVRNYAALREKGVEFTAIPAVDGDRNKLPAFLAATPYGKTPVLIDGAISVFESNLINEYVDERFPQPPLMPDGPKDRVEARKWIHYCDQALIPQLSAIARAEPGDRGRVAAGLAERIRWVETMVLDRQFVGPYFFGECFSLLDIVFHTFFTTLDAIRTQRDDRGVTLPRGFVAWEEAIRARESIRFAEAFREAMEF